VTQDYPDWIRAFNLVGTNITIPINIEASDVTLPVSIEACDLTLKVWIIAQLVVLDVNLKASAITLDVNITASEVTISINFADQSVAVFDAPKWFAHEAQQVFVTGLDTLASGSWGLIASRFVPAGSTYFLTVVSIGYNGATNANVGLYLVIGGTITIRLNGMNGAGLTFDTPLRLEGYDAVELYGLQVSGGAAAVTGGFGGYDEID